MQISSNVNFRARYVNTAQIKKLNPVTKEYDNFNANFVELENLQDVLNIDSIRTSWRSGYSSNIIDNAKEWFTQFHPAGYQTKFYALTLQNDYSWKLIPEKVVGLAEMAHNEHSDKYELIYLQTKPDYKYEEHKERKYKHIGTAILEGMKNIYKNCQITLMTTKSAQPFYQKNGFISESEKPDRLFLENH